MASESVLLHSNSIVRCHVTLHDLSSLWRDCYQVFDDDDDEIKGAVLVMDINPALLHKRRLCFPAVGELTCLACDHLCITLCKFRGSKVTFIVCNVAVLHHFRWVM